MLRKCLSALKYIRTYRVAMKDGCLYLPNGGPIPNNGSGCGLKQAIDTWATASSMLTPEPTPSLPQLPYHPSMPSSHDTLLHMSLSFEVVQHEAHMAQITDTADESSKEIYNMFEVFATESKKCQFKPSKLPDTPSQVPASCSTPSPQPDGKCGLRGQTRNGVQAADR